MEEKAAMSYTPVITYLLNNFCQDPSEQKAFINWLNKVGERRVCYTIAYYFDNYIPESMRIQFHLPCQVDEVYRDEIS